MIYRFFPIPSCRMGALWTLSDIKGACIIEFGPAGTTHFAMEGMMTLNAEGKAKTFTTHISERDLTFGNTLRLEKSVLEVDQAHMPEVIFVMSSTLSAIIVIDLSSVCEMLQPSVKAKLIPVKSDGFKGDFTYGVEEVLKLLAQEVVENSMEKQVESSERTYNVIGANMDGLSMRSDVRSLGRMMTTLYDANVKTVFTSGASMIDIRRASEASLNISLRLEGVAACSIMEKRFSQPFVTHLPYGIEGIEAFCNAVENATGWSRNMKAFDALIREAKSIVKHIREIASREQKRVMITGHYDDVNGIMTMMKAFGYTNLMGLVNHKIKNIINREPHYIEENVDEMKKRALIESFSPDMIIGDGVTIELANELLPDRRILTFQTANPNLGMVLLHHEVPHIGFDGINYLGQNIIAMEK